MERLCTGKARAKRLSTLAQAADCLAKAAVTLSEAARAAAESFSSDLLDIPAGIDSLSDDEGRDEECTNSEHAEQPLSSNDDEPGEWATSSPVQHETNNTGRYTEGAYYSGLMAIDQQRFDPYRTPSDTSVTTEIGNAPGLAYRILVEREADVLLFVCALIQHRRKVICYMNCSIPAFHMYKRFINDVTATSVYTITKITTAEISEVGQKFLETDRSILLLPETITPSTEIDEVDSWVVHVGWPYDEQRYDAQRSIHQAQNSIVVACSEDEELYPAGAAIMWRSQPWPGDIDSFRVSVALLRPVFVQKLALLPSEIKAKVYPDWIGCHGPQGHRYVKSWDASTLVKRANSFLLDVLKYEAPGPKYLGSDPGAFLPEVSEGFVAHNSLELAVEDGVLRVKIPGSGLNHLSSLPTTDWIEPVTSDWRVPKPSKQSKPNSGNRGRRSYVDGALTGSPTTEWGEPSTSDWGAPTPNSQVGPNYGNTGRQSYANAAITGSPSSWSNVAPPQPGIRGRLTANPSTGHSFKSMTGNTYLTIEEEFEAIPLMCFLATNSPSTFRKAVLFFNNSGCQVHYRTLVERITGWRVFTSEDKKNQSSQELGSDFVKCQQPAILLLHFRLRSLPPALENVPLGYCIYWGSTLGGSIQLAQVNKQRAWLNCGSTCLIMTAEQTSKMSPKLNASGFVEHPNSADLHHRHTSPWLSSLRAKTSSALSGEPQLVKGLYEAHLRTLGRNSRFLGAEIIASRMNHFAANVLLAGESKDGSKKYPPLASRPVAPLSVVDECNLQEAVDAGLLYVW